MYNTVKPNNNLMHWLHQASGTMRTIASTVIVAYLILILSPSAEVIAAEIGNSNSPSQSPETELSESFVEAIENLALLKQLRAEDKNTDAVLGKLNTLKSRIEALDETVMANFDDIETDLIDKQLPAVILQRHTDMVDHYRTQHKEFMDVLTEETETGFISDVTRGVSNLIGGNEVTPNEAAGNAFGKFKTKDFKRSHQEFDPENLPTKSLQPDKTKKPKETKQEFIQSGLKNSPRMQVAALGDFTFNNLEEAADPLYLAESDEVQLTESIQAKAAELDHDAVKIYHWVRNNIEWLPSWGAIQDAELTLEAQRGNAMDIASLTISLLRASGIPARYVHGTIDVPVEKFNNWAGGFTSWEAAGNYASSAGIPITSIISGGQVSKMRMEHVWVEAATDFHPSRGAKNKDADTWVQLDPSYKQYEFQDGLDVVAISGLDVDQLAQDFEGSGAVNETEGWATGFDSAIFQQAQIETEAKLEAYIGTLENPTIGDVIGGKTAIIKEYPMLPSSLSNSIKVVGTRYDKLPSALQQKIEFAFQKDILGDLIDPISFPFSKLNNEKVTLSFKPATQTDEDALEAFIPDASQLPTKIPSYLIQVLPELKVNGITVKTGLNMSLGEELPLTTGIKLVGRGYATSPRTYKVISGSFLHVNVFAGSVSPVKLQNIVDKIGSTKDIYDGGIESELNAITREDILGDMYYASGLAYYGELLTEAKINGNFNSSFYSLLGGYGTIGYEPNVDSFFGIPRGIKIGGVVFNIPMISATATKDGSIENTRIFTQEMGAYSSGLEHSVPERIFTKNEQVVSAISAVKALQIANSNNQRIYKINSSNMSNVLPILNLDNDSLLEIRSALNVGKEVITHPEAVSVPGWSGFGYIILDSDVGDGAYKISGGFNGGSQKDTSEGGSNLIASLIGSKLANYSAQDVSLILMCVAYNIGKIIGDLLTFGKAIKNAKNKNSLIKKLAFSLRGIFTRASLTLTFQAVFLAILFQAIFELYKCIIDNAIGLNQRVLKFRCV